MNLFFAAVLAGALLSVHAQESKPLNFQEVFNLVRTNLPGISEEELSRLAAVGLIKELGTKAQLVTNSTAATLPAGDLIGRRTVYNEAYPYIQVRWVDDRLPAEFQTWVSQVASNKSARGLVVDLRYAQGTAYEAAAKVADLFTKSGDPLLKLGTNQIVATEKPKAADLPVAILVNRETKGAAEALAALLRESGSGLTFGSTTAGEAHLFEKFALSTGQLIQIGTVPIQVGDQKTIPAKGITPDIVVAVSPAAEKYLYQDPYRSAASAAAGASTNEAANATNRARRFNEAELVRRHKSGASLDDPSAPSPAAAPAAENPDQPVMGDPVLARALDFLKGISALQHRPQ